MSIDPRLQAAERPDATGALTSGSACAVRRSPGRVLWGRLRRDRVAVAGLAIIAVLVTTAVFAPYLAPYDPAHQSLADRLAGPSMRHLLGTDQFGRDVLSRLIYGSRVELAVGLSSVLISLVLGTTLGTFAAYRAGAADEVTMRVLDVLLAFPYLLLAILVVSLLGAHLRSTIIAVGIWATPGFARVIRGLVLTILNQQYIEAAQAAGARTLRIVGRYILPNCVSVLIVYGALYTASAILLEAPLSFLGLGVQPPTASWGLMVSSGRNYLLEAPHIATFAGLAIALAVLGFNLFADGLQDALDTKLTL
jgi:peptide/nickel transport system permease protein